MSGIGPELPPYLLAKRKRKQEEQAEDEDTATSGAKRSPSPSAGEKRRRVMGPAMPPAPLDERPSEPSKPSEESDSDDDDDGFGPSLPPVGAKGANDDVSNGENGSAAQFDPTPSEQKLKRDDWMMMPPKQDDLAARLDPTKQRPRGFNTGKGARGPSATGEDNSIWNETPQEKQKRLADEMMGVSKPSSMGPQRPPKASDSMGGENAAKKIKEHTEKARGPSLMERHKDAKGAAAEDDPSKRAFDREKDMGSGVRIGNVQRQQMLNKASDYSSKFSGGSYL